MASRMKNKDKAPQSVSGPIFYWSTMVLTILGFADALYLLIYKLSGDNKMCIGNGGCHDVNFSPYAMLFGIPVSVYGLAAYLLIVVLLLLELRSRFVRKNGPLALFAISLGGVLFSVYLTYLELYKIRAICPFCVASAIIITLIFILAIIRYVNQSVN